jgi:urate oxidase
MPKMSPAPADPAAPANLSSLRTQSFPLKAHNHGKAKVRVMKVVRSAEKHFAYEYSVDTTLFSPEYEKVFTAEDNSGLVATDTQKNTVYVIAKRTEANSPEQFGIDLCKHFISEVSARAKRAHARAIGSDRRLQPTRATTDASDNRRERQPTRATTDASDNRHSRATTDTREGRRRLRGAPSSNAREMPQQPPSFALASLAQCSSNNFLLLRSLCSRGAPTTCLFLCSLRSPPASLAPPPPTPHLTLRAQYPVLTAAQAEVRMTLWERAVVDGEEHEHGWIKQSPEQAVAVVKLVREGEVFSVRSFVKGMTIFKSTQSGFADYHMDKYTLLPPCTERCLSTELTAEWGYTDIAGVDFADARAGVRAQLIKGIFGPAKGGVFSVSLQATIYDAGCLVLTEVACVSEIKIDTPNKHYLPYRQLEALGEVFEDDIFVPTDEPSGTITCTVARE